jgi:hypothetical protein
MNFTQKIPEEPWRLRTLLELLVYIYQRRLSMIYPDITKRCHRADENRQYGEDYFVPSRKLSRALLLRAIIWRRRKSQGIARPMPSALHLDFFAAAKPLLLGTARGEVTLHLSLDKRKFWAI